ncbi:MAG: formimidoylglutamase [Chitinophagales bacterium]
MQSFFLLGCEDDRAVANNNGRIGAAKGPEIFQHFFKKTKSRGKWPEVLAELNLISPEKDIASTHIKVATELSRGHQKSPYSIFIGGGHDYAYPHLSGVKNSISGELGCINIDPHFDLRKPNPEILSGSPFYMAIEKGVIKGENLVEFGIGEHCNGQELWDYAEAKNIEVHTFPELRQANKVLQFNKVLKGLSKRVDKIVLSIDLDAIQAAYAPGVSAPAAEGFTPSEVLGMAAIAASEEKVFSLGIFELNPNFDIDNRTARLAALLAFEFIRNKRS